MTTQRIRKCNRNEQVKCERNPKPIMNISQAIHKENN
jgi:hypothetical protein